MALVSPGVQVTVTDESFFVPASAPTVPLIFVASAAEKAQPDGVTPAAGTFESGVVRTVTSLNQSVELYGEPVFQEDANGVQLHGDARNEYGLFALNQFLGVGNRAFVVRADVNLNDDINDLRDIWDSKMTEASTLLTTLVSNFITEFNDENGLVPSDALYKETVTESEFLDLAREATDLVWEFYSFRNSEENFFDDHTVPASATSGSQTANFNGRIDQGQQQINFNDSINAAQQVIDVDGVASGSPTATGLGVGSPEAGAGSPAPGPAYEFNVVVDGGSTQTIVVEGASAQTYEDLVNEINDQLSGAVADIVSGNVQITSLTTGSTSSVSITDGSSSPSPVVFPLFDSLPDFVEVRTATSGGSNLTGLANDATTYSVLVDVDSATGSPTQQTLEVQGQNAQTFAELVTLLNAQLTGATVAITDDGNLLVWSNLVDADESSISVTDVDLLSNIKAVVGAGSPTSLGSPTVDAATVGESNPTGLDNDSTVYTASINVDGAPRAVQVTGSAAQTYGTLLDEINVDLGNSGSPLSGGVAEATIVEGNIVVTSASTGTSSTVSVTDTDLFSSLDWFVSLNTSQAGTDSDASLNVFTNGYDQLSTGSYDGLEGIASTWVNSSLGAVEPGEWSADEAADTLLAAADDYKFTVEFRNEISLGANNAARRTAIVTALQSAINSNTEVRSDAFEFNLVVTPGYHEVVDEMLSLVTDLEGEAFVIADTPMNMSPSEVVNWADTSARQSSPSVAYYYPHSLASNLDGVNVLSAASGTALRTYAFSDNVSELWFAPAGTRRGLVTGVSQVGYVNTSGTFVETNLNLGQRDDLYKYFTNINPIVFFQGRGIVVWGQKTSSPDTSARDRVNVERLVAYVRRQLRKSLLSFVFEPNDALTRDSVKAAVDNFLGDLIVRRGLFDFATVVDESNNTPDRIDRNELWVDVALQPVKAAEFIMVPIRIVATGTEI